MRVVNLYFISGLMLTTRETGLIRTSANQARVQALVIIEKEREIITYWTKDGESSELWCL